MYKPIDILYELPRINFIVERDGFESAVNFAKQTVKMYVATVRAYKKKPGGFNHPFRYGYTESAVSARHILRNQRLIG